MDLNEIKLYLPKYLSPSSEQNLFEQLKNFPQNIDSRIYSEDVRLENNLYQGDGIEGLLVTNLPNPDIRSANAMVLSNTCDINPQNKRLFPSHFCYSPILKMAKFREQLIANKVDSNDRIEQFMENIRNQRISQILFLPFSGELKEDSFIFFDRINSCSLSYLESAQIAGKKLFSLSDYGLYLFLFKLSIHFTRINEGKGRDIG
jgi:hypothetical protein